MTDWPSGKKASCFFTASISKETKPSKNKQHLHRKKNPKKISFKSRCTNQKSEFSVGFGYFFKKSAFVALRLSALDGNLLNDPPWGRRCAVGRRSHLFYFYWQPLLLLFFQKIWFLPKKRLFFDDFSFSSTVLTHLNKYFRFPSPPLQLQRFCFRDEKRFFFLPRRICFLQFVVASKPSSFPKIFFSAEASQKSGVSEFDFLIWLPKHFFLHFFWFCLSEKPKEKAMNALCIFEAPQIETQKKKKFDGSKHGQQHVWIRKVAAKSRWKNRKGFLADPPKISSEKKTRWRKGRMGREKKSC